MADRARTVAQVIAGEAASGTLAERQADMRAIASVIANRSRALGVTQEQVVQNQREFNAYNKALPAGTAKLTSMAQEAVDYVDQNGPLHGATFYATPAATRNLPKGLQAIAETTGHRYFSDPRGRAINTAVGTRPFNAAALSRPAKAIAAPPRPSFASPTVRSIETARGTVPASKLSPVTAARVASIGGLLSNARPAAQALARPAAAASPRTASLTAPVAASRLAAASPALTGFAPAARPSAPVKVGQALSPLRAAAAPISARPAPAVASQAKAVASRDITPAALDKSPRLSAPVRTKSTLSAAGEANLAGRLGDVAPARVSTMPSMSPRTSLTAAAPATGAVRAIGGLLSPTAAAAPARQVTPTAPVRATATVAPQVSTARAVAPVSTARVAPAVSAPKTLGPVASTARAVSPVDRQAQSLSPVPSTAVAASVRTRAPENMGPMMSPERALAMDVADLDRQRNIAPRPSAALPALTAPVNVPARRVAAVAPVKVAAVAQPKPVAAAPPRQVAARPAIGIGMAAPRGTGLGLPGIPSAPRQPSALGRLGSVIGSNKAAIGGGLIGAAALGPIGGLIGGLVGSAIGRGPAPSQAAKAAMASGAFDGFSHSGSGGSRAGASIGTGGAASGASRGNGIGPGGSGPRDPSGPGTGRNATGSNNNTSKSSSKKR